MENFAPRTTRSGSGNTTAFTAEGIEEAAKSTTTTFCGYRGITAPTDADKAIASTS